MQWGEVILGLSVIVCFALLTRRRPGSHALMRTKTWDGTPGVPGATVPAHAEAGRPTHYEGV